MHSKRWFYMDFAAARKKWFICPNMETELLFIMTNGIMIYYILIRFRRTLNLFKIFELSKALRPDDISVRLLRQITIYIYLSFIMFYLYIFAIGCWSFFWNLHYLISIFKRRNIFDALNYRGMQLIFIIFKMAERLIACPFIHYYLIKELFDINQWTCQPRRSSKDLFILLACGVADDFHDWKDRKRLFNRWHQRDVRSSLEGISSATNASKGNKWELFAVLRFISWWPTWNIKEQ